MIKCIKIVKGKCLVAVFLSVLMILMSACGNENVQQANNNKKIVAGLAMIDLKLPFFVRMKEAGTKAAEEYGIEVIWQSADGSLEKQISIVENFIEQKVDVILIDPLDAKGIIPAIEKAKAAGIPVITMGNKVEGKWNHNTLYPDYENMAMVARSIGTALNGKGEVALLTGSAGNFVSDTREKGFVETMKKEFPNIKIVGVQPTNFDPAQAQRITETWLNNFPNLKAIAFISDPLGLAAMSVADAKGKKLLFGGYDGNKEMHPMIENGSMMIDVLTGAERVGYWNVAVAARIAKGSKMPVDLYMPTYFVTSDQTATMLKNKGLTFEYITPEKAISVAQNYSEEFGPNQPDERIIGNDDGKN